MGGGSIYEDHVIQDHKSCDQNAYNFVVLLGNHVSFSSDDGWVILEELQQVAYGQLHREQE